MPGLNLEKAKLRVSTLGNRNKYRYSRPVEGNFNDLAPGEFTWWKYKFYIKQVEKAEKGKHIEQYFLKQDLSFSLDPAFEKKSSFTLTAGGDLLPGDQITPSATEHVWDDVKDFYFAADTVYANLETPFALSQPVGNAPKSGIKDAPKLNGTEEIFNRFVNNGKGINFFSTANNHCLNQGVSGLMDTLNFLDSKGYGHVGTSRTVNERDDVPIIRKNGVNVAFLSYTFSLNGDELPTGKEYIANYIRLNKPDEDISLVKQHVQTARSKKADIVVACLHWSLEFESYPIENVIKMGHRILDETGVDVILGNHAHVIQPIERYRFTDPFSGKQKDGIIVYSLGNLISDFVTKNCRISWLVKLNFAKGIQDGKEKTVIEDLKIKPVYTYKRFESGKCVDFRLLDFLTILREQKTGKSRFTFNKKEEKELFRLEKLFYKLLPAKQNGLLENENSFIIKLSGINKTFFTKDKEVKALKNINLEIKKGDIFGVIGYSGAGKSTLIRIINLLEVPDSGVVTVNGVSLTEIPANQLRQVRSSIGMIFQGFNLMNSIDVYNNIAAPLKNKKVPKNEINAKVDDLLKLVGLEDKKHAYPNQLSGGQKQRVAIARALCSDPQILLCDEATSALDPNTTQSILQLLKEIHDKLGLTIVVITHQMEVVKSICSRVAVMEQGEIVEQGDIVDIFTNPQSEIGKTFVSHSLGSDSAEQNFDNYKGKIYKLSFFGAVTHQPVLTDLSQHYHVKVNILFGNIENLYNTVVGSLIVEFIGKDEDVRAAIEYYKSLDTKVEVIRDAQ